MVKPVSIKIKERNGPQDTNNYCIIIAGLVITLYAWGFLTLNPALLGIANEFQVSPELVGLLLSFYALPGIIAIPIYGVLCDKYGRRRVLLPLVLVFGITGIIAGFITDFVVLLLIRLLQGIAAASFFPLSYALMGDLFQGDKRSYAISMVSTINMGFSIILPIFGGFLTLISWRFVFISFSAAIPIFLAAFFLLPNTGMHIDHSHQYSDLPIEHSNNQNTEKENLISRTSENLDTIKKKWPFLVVSLLGIFYFLGIYGAVNLFLPYYVEEGINQTPFYTGIILAIRGIVTTILSARMGWFMSRVSKPWLLIGGFSLASIGCFLLMQSPAVIWLWFAMILIGVSMGLTFSPLNAYVLDITPGKYRGRVTSGFQVGIKIGQTLGPYIAALAYITFGNQLWAPFSIGMWASIIGGLFVIPLVSFSRETGLGLPEKTLNILTKPQDVHTGEKC